MSKKLVQCINQSVPLLREANINAYPIQDYLTIHFDKRTATREEGILAAAPAPVMECRASGLGWGSRIVSIIAKNSAPISFVVGNTIIPEHLNIDYLFAKTTNQPNTTELTP